MPTSPRTSPPGARCTCSCHDAPTRAVEQATPDSPIDHKPHLDQIANIDRKIETNRETIKRLRKTNELLHARSAELQDRRNYLAVPLPAELLCMVFSYLTSPYGGGKFRKWFLFSHVCRRWRLTAFNCPALWTYLDLRQSDLTEAMISRSGTLPLSLTIVYNFSDVLRLSNATRLALVRSFQQLIRIQALSICTGYAEMTAFLISLRGPAPMLQDLSLNVLESVIAPEPTPIPAISNDVFQRSTPRLREVRLIGILFSWECGILRSLTSLHISGRSSDEADLSLVHMLMALGTMPALRELYLRNTLHESVPELIDFRPIELPRLAQFYLSDECFDTCAQFLEHILISVDATIIVKVVNKSDTRFSELDDACQSLWDALYLVVLRRNAERPAIAVALREGDSLIMKIWFSAARDDSSRMEFTVPWDGLYGWRDAQIRGEWEAEAFVSDWRDMHFFSPQQDRPWLRHVEQLYLSGFSYGTVDAEEFQALLQSQQLPALQILHVNDAAVDLMADVLMKNASAPTAGILFPSISTLVTGDAYNTFHVSLARALELRQDLGSPLRELHLDGGSYPVETGNAMLSGLVETLVVEGRRFKPCPEPSTIVEETRASSAFIDYQGGYPFMLEVVVEPH